MSVTQTWSILRIDHAIADMVEITHAHMLSAMILKLA